MKELAGLNLNPPSQMNWETFNPQSGYVPPPPVEDAEGNRIIYTGVLPKAVEFGADDDGYLEVLVDPIVITGPIANGAQIRFTRQSVKAFQKNGKDLNVNPLGKLLRSAGSKASPNTNEQYVMAVNQILGKPTHFSLDWSAYNKDTGEAINGFRSFPMDPERPGQRKTILKKGDSYNLTDKKGNITGTAQVKSEVIFANARIRSFVEPNKGQ